MQTQNVLRNFSIGLYTQPGNVGYAGITPMMDTLAVAKPFPRTITDNYNQLVLGLFNTKSMMRTTEGIPMRREV